MSTVVSVKPSPDQAQDPATRRTREITLIAAIVVVILGTLVGIGVLITLGGPRASAADVPVALSDQAAPAPVTNVQTTDQTAAVGDPLKASQSWIDQTSRSSGIPATAIAAYGDATLVLAKEQPSCHLGWSTLAGVGSVESENGIIGGRVLQSDGLSSTPITGPALNGAGGYAAIGNGSGGWTSALGPMQFIPSTWSRWGADGNGDGYHDINNIFDAAVAAGRYLCADGRDLATAQGYPAAIFSYTHAAAYVQAVSAAATAAAR